MTSWSKAPRSTVDAPSLAHQSRELVRIQRNLSELGRHGWRPPFRGMEREAFRNVMDDAPPCIHEAGPRANSGMAFLKSLFEHSGPDVSVDPLDLQYRRYMPQIPLCGTRIFGTRIGHGKEAGQAFVPVLEAAFYQAAAVLADGVLDF